MLLGQILYTGTREIRIPNCEVIKDISLHKADIPLLIIGYENAKLYIDNFDVLTSTYIEQDKVWTPSILEDREQYNNTLNSYREFCIDRLYSRYTYRYYNILQKSWEEIKKLYKYFFMNKTPHRIYNTGKMLFYIHNKTICGVSLTLLEYMGIKKKVLERLEQTNFILPANETDNKKTPIKIEEIVA